MARKNHPRKKSTAANSKRSRLVTELVNKSLQYVDFSNVAQQNADYIKLVARGFASRQVTAKIRNLEIVSIDNLIPKVIYRIQPIAVNYGAIINYIPKPPIKTKPKPQTSPVEKPEALPKKALKK
jgi:hypothetical protein